MKPWMSKEQMEALMREAPDKSLQLRYLAEINGVSLEEICTVLGIKHEHRFKLTTQLKKYGWTEEQLKTVFCMHERKCTRAEIAKAVGHSVGAVDRIFTTAINRSNAPIPRKYGKKKSHI